MTEPSLTTLICDENQERENKWSSFVDGEDGFFYGIPFCARRVVKFNPLDKSLTEIGPDLGDGEAKWWCGVRANTGSIYCAPYGANRILKINTNDGTVEILDVYDCQRPVMACGHQGHLQLTIVFTICHPMPVAS